MVTMAVPAASGTGHGWLAQEWDWDPFRMCAQKAPALGSSSAQPSKRSLVQPHPEHKLPNPRCQVEGCTADFFTLRDYHIRYRVCDMHLKSNCVLHKGEQQRFCQQCGRFHPLGCFDSIKRSCRDQLSKHNARRRKIAEKEHVGERNAAAASSRERQMGNDGSLVNSSKRRRTSVQPGADDQAMAVLQRVASGEGSSSATCDFEPLQRGDSTASQLPPLTDLALMLDWSPAGGTGHSNSDCIGPGGLLREAEPPISGSCFDARKEHCALPEGPRACCESVEGPVVQPFWELQLRPQPALSLEQRSNSTTTGVASLGSFQRAANSGLGSNTCEDNIFKHVYDEFAGAPAAPETAGSSRLSTTLNADGPSKYHAGELVSSTPFRQSPQQQQQQQQAAGGEVGQALDSQLLSARWQQQELREQRQCEELHCDVLALPRPDHHFSGLYNGQALPGSVGSKTTVTRYGMGSFALSDSHSSIVNRSSAAFDNGQHVLSLGQDSLMQSSQDLAVPIAAQPLHPYLDDAMDAIMTAHGYSASGVHQPSCTDHYMHGMPENSQLPSRSKAAMLVNVYAGNPGAAKMLGNGQRMLAANGATRACGNLAEQHPSESWTLPFDQHRVAAGTLHQVQDAQQASWQQRQQEQQQRFMQTQEQQLCSKVQMSRPANGTWGLSSQTPAGAGLPVNAVAQHSYSGCQSFSERRPTFLTYEAQMSALRSRPMALPIPDHLLDGLCNSLAPAAAPAAAATTGIGGSALGSGFACHFRGSGYSSPGYSMLPPAHVASGSGMLKSPSAAFDEAQRVTSTYRSQERLETMSVKLLHAHPGDLPLNLKEALMTAAGDSSMCVCYLRQGCVHLTVDMLQPQAAQALTAVQLAGRLLAEAGCASDFWRVQDMQVQAGGALARAPACSQAWIVNAPLQLPVSSRVTPMCIYESTTDRLTLTVKHVTVEKLRLHVRGHGRYYPIVEAIAAPTDQPDQVHLSFRLGVTAPCGLLKVEASSGQLSADTQLVLVVDEPGMVHEVRELEQQELPYAAVVDVLTDLGRVLEFKWTMGQLHEEAAAADSSDDEHHELLQPEVKPVAPLWDYSAAEIQALVLTARRLACFVCRRGWSATLASLMPVVSIGCSSAAEVLRVLQLSDPQQLDLQHLALTSQRPAMLHFVLTWGSAHGLTWRSEPVGTGRPTSLHVETMSNDSFPATDNSAESPGVPLHVAALFEDNGAGDQRLEWLTESHAQPWTGFKAAEDASLSDCTVSAKYGQQHIGSPIDHSVPSYGDCMVAPYAPHATADRTAGATPLPVGGDGAATQTLATAADHTGCGEGALPQAANRLSLLLEGRNADAPKNAVSWVMIAALIAGAAALMLQTLD